MTIFSESRENPARVKKKILKKCWNKGLFQKNDYKSPLFQHLTVKYRQKAETVPDVPLPESDDDLADRLAGLRS